MTTATQTLDERLEQLVLQEIEKALADGQEMRDASGRPWVLLFDVDLAKALGCTAQRVRSRLAVINGQLFARMKPNRYWWYTPLQEAGEALPTLAVDRA